MKMFDEETNQDSETQVEENSSHEQEVEVEEQHEGGYNPVFEPIRQTLGIQFESILPDLKQIEKGFNSGITNANSKYAPWKVLDEQGYTPDSITQGFSVLQKLNEAPEEIYQALGQFLKENGRLPETEAEVQQAVEDADGEDLTDTDKRLAQLQEQFDNQQKFLEAQQSQFQMEQMNAKAQREVAQEYDAFEKAHPELTDADRQEIYQRHYQYAASGPQNVKSLEDVAKEYTGLVERIRSAPRPNDSAPRLPGAGGGVPTGQRKPVDQLSREESRDMLAELLQQNNQ